MVNIWVDGGCHGNGTANTKTYGSFFVEGERTPYRLELAGRTNNEAEFLALINALEYCKANKIQPSVKQDSQLVVNQVQGRWKVKTQSLRLFVDEAKALLKETGGTIEWVSRDVIFEILGH